jgi:hypothetical protein
MSWWLQGFFSPAQAKANGGLMPTYVVQTPSPSSQFDKNWAALGVATAEWKPGVGDVGRSQFNLPLDFVRVSIYDS